MKFRFWKPEPVEALDEHEQFIADLGSDTPLFDQLYREASPQVRALLRRRAEASTRANNRDVRDGSPTASVLVGSKSDRGGAAEIAAAPASMKVPD